MIVINFAQKLRQYQMDELEMLSRKKVERVWDVRVAYNEMEPYGPQVKALVERIPIDAETYRSETFLVNLPPSVTYSAALLAELTRRMGRMPLILRQIMRPSTNIVPRQIVVEVLDLQAILNGEVS